MKNKFAFLFAILATFITLQGQIPTNGLVAHYSFDNTLNDAASGYNLSSSGITYGVGEIENAFSFTGSEECYSTDVNFRRVFDNTNSWSVSMWYYSSVPYNEATGFGTNAKMLFACDGVNSSPYKRTWIRASELGLHLSRMLGSGNGVELVAEYSFLPNTWYHISVNYDGNNTTVYINGTIVDYNITGDIVQDIGSVDANTERVTIGGNRQDNVIQWKGLIDQTYVYNRTLTSEEVKGVFEESGRSVLDEGLVAYYPFNANANDESGNGINGTVTGATLTTDRFGNSNSAYKFDGSDDYIENDNSAFEIFGSQSASTFSLWFKTNRLDTNMSFFSKGYHSDVPASGNKYYALEYIGTLNRFTVTIYNYSTLHSAYAIIDTSKFNQNEWHHLVAIRSNSIQIFLDGINITSSHLDDGWTTNYNMVLENLPARWGVRNYANPENVMEDFDGDIDDIRVYDRAISNVEIKELYHENEYATVSDIDGNIYGTVTIGNQTWMAENLKTTRYQNGDAVGTTIPASLDIRSEPLPKYQWAYGGNESNVNTYGRFYTWYAATDERKLCPAGWHLPSDSEWKELEMYLGMPQEQADAIGWRGTDQGTQLKSETGWLIEGADVGTNTTGFTALPSGVRTAAGVYGDITEVASWWTSNIIDETTTWQRYLNNYNNTESNGIVRNPTEKNNGLTVRCLKSSSKSISVINDTVNEGQQVILPISVSDLSVSDNIISNQFDINFDTTVLEYSAADITGTLAEGGTVEVNTSVAGKLSISYMTSTALFGTGELINLQFNTLKADTTEVTISNAYLNSSPITNLTNGNVIVRDVTPPTVAISYDDTENRCGDDLLLTATFTEPMLEANALKLSMTGGATLTNVDMTRLSETVYTYLFAVPNSSGDVTVSLSSGTDLWSNEVVATPTSGNTFTIIPITYGDVDDDGTILAYDAALALQYSVGLDPLPTIDPLPWENWRDTTANVDGVGAITANDAGMILQYSVGIITSFDAGAKKSITATDVKVEVVDGEIVFYSSGELIGLNLSTVNENNLLGAPVIVADNFLSAENIEGTSYKVGLCTSTPAFEGDILMKIPFNANGSITFDLVANALEKSVTVDLATGINELQNDGIKIYPNPAREMLHIEGLQEETIGQIYNANGQMFRSDFIGIENDEINVSGLPSGLYILKLSIDDVVIVKRFTKE